MGKYINLKIPEHSYFFGFAQTDGSLSSPKKFPNKGKFQIEINAKDLHILKSFKKLFPLVYSSTKKRIRDTNFKNNHISYTWTVSDKSFRDEINELGVPYGKKSEIIYPPKTDFCERDYIRGLIDGDGSLGITARKVPFASFTVKSENLKNYLLDIIEKITGERKRLNKNKRDDIYNIMINREKAQKIIKYLYYPKCLCLKRKLKSAKIALNWKRPKGLVRILNKKFWDKIQDKYILNHKINESCNYLKRTRRSIGMRLWRLRNNKATV
ncbi:MAG: hypothetical protein COU82_01735 [Candidatus Portnoybacteria bacterium CG10_big_fil_rev_8_21_14_0_10_38_18]|uniref:Uncharacterized protein n=1 Tax=Candidatus Portnoybacteria bacterium CG10_big_fil_rev_8_21_14_0_10_38_18 TaxID=1974813 RepID=A0A2M8KC27_9BACT|nr:MAG: hypothetical protein COU82_01735 [Candidatus Portnoybacteria bacterium CG10_big_fil_rev_8_21_14_0_10_38_18]